MVTLEQQTNMLLCPLNKDIGTRKVAAGGFHDPTAFGSLGSSTLTLTLREADTGHHVHLVQISAWVVFTMI